MYVLWFSHIIHTCLQSCWITSAIDICNHTSNSITSHEEINFKGSVIWESLQILFVCRDYDRSQIVFASTGLAARWYATQGEHMWNTYGAVVFDEIDQMSKDPGYALLWESASKEHLRRQQTKHAHSLLVSCRADCVFHHCSSFIYTAIGDPHMLIIGKNVCADKG